jgi:hypothetical protein
MRFKMLTILAALAIVISFSAIASAQYMTQDVVFVKFGYIPVYNVTVEEEDYEANGFAVQGEYNLNFSGFWMGFGMEYQYITQDLDGDKINHHFILPMASLKVAAVGGLYVGGGLSGKYLIATKSFEDGDTKFKKDIDLWANGILGYHQPIGEGIFLDLEGRFGWNLTNRQFSKTDPDTGKYDVKRAYDIGFYAGVGFRALGSNY